MIERHVTFHILPNKGKEFVRFFEEEYRPAMAKSEGFLKAELLKEMEVDQDFVMILHFESTDAAAGWHPVTMRSLNLISNLYMMAASSEYWSLSSKDHSCLRKRGQTNTTLE
jgi:antibiotic biosynthesis monooxygenase (ABM) superfamily enzyme